MRNPITTFVLTALLTAALLPATGFAATGRLNFQGRLVDAASKNPKNGTFNLTFRICETQSGSCATPLWTEVQSVPVVNGLFSAQLGAATPLTSAVFAMGAERFLEIQVESETLATRERLNGSAYAFRSSLADDVAPGLPQYIQNATSLQAGSRFHVGEGVVDGQLRLGSFASLPAAGAPGAGSVVFNTGDGLLYLSNGTSWTPLALGGDSGLNSLSAGSGIVITGTGTARTVAADAGTGANQLVQLDANGKLPPMDASLLTNIPGGYRAVTLLSDAMGAPITPIAMGSEPQGLVSRRAIDLTGATMVRAQFASSLAGPAIKCRVEFSADDGATWDAAPLVADFPAGASADQNSKSAWAALPAAAAAEVLVRAVILGDGLLSPTIRYIEVDFK